MAGLTPEDVDVYTCYDPFTIVTLMQIEDSGFCEKGAAGEMARSPQRLGAYRAAAASPPHVASAGPDAEC
jgi:acetyl-CoA acetyltransferase